MEQSSNPLPPKRDQAYAYKMGFDCGKNGVTDENCHFSIFSSPENTKAWQQGKTDGEQNIPGDVIDSIYPPTDRWAYYSPEHDQWYDQDGEKLPNIW